MIHLYEEQWRDLSCRVGAELDPAWKTYSEEDRTHVALLVEQQLKLVYARLEPDHAPCHYSGLTYVFRAAALDYLVLRLRETMIYADARDEELRLRVSEAAISATAARLLDLATCAYRFLPIVNGMEAQLEELSGWDIEDDYTRHFRQGS